MPRFFYRLQQCWAASCIDGSVIIQIIPGKYELFYKVGSDRPTLVYSVASAVHGQDLPGQKKRKGIGHMIMLLQSSPRYRPASEGVCVMQSCSSVAATATEAGLSSLVDAVTFASTALGVRCRSLPPLTAVRRLAC